MIKYFYSDREEVERQDYQSENTPINHSNVFTYAQSLILFHDDNSVPKHSWCDKSTVTQHQQSSPMTDSPRLKMKFREKTPTKKRDLPKEVKFIDNEDLSPAEEKLRLQPASYVHPTSNNSGGGRYTGRGSMCGRGGYKGR